MPLVYLLEEHILKSFMYKSFFLLYQDNTCQLSITEIMSTNIPHSEVQSHNSIKSDVISYSLKFQQWGESWQKNEYLYIINENV